MMRNPSLGCFYGHGLTKLFYFQIENRASMPLVLVLPALEMQMLEKLFLDNDHFAFDSKKVSNISESFL